MSKRVKFSNPALKKKSTSNNKEQFNLAVNVNSFNGVFDLQKLDSQEEEKLQKLLESNWSPDSLTKKQVAENLIQLKALTAEIKSISRQGSFLIGERVAKARELLKPYRDGTFTLWLETALGSKRSGYNFLSYYELYIVLPNEELKNKYKKMPQRAAYHLANRKGDIQKKFAIIEKHYESKGNEIIKIVQEEFANKDFRSRRSVDGLLNRLLEAIDQLAMRQKELSAEDLEKIKYAKGRLLEVLKRLN